MTDDEWEKQRVRAVMTTFQTGRPVFADTDGDLRYTDGDRERIPADVGVAKQPVPRATALATRAHRASRWAFVASSVAAVANAIVGLWHPWQLAVAAVCVFSAAVWYRVNQRQRALLRGADAQDPGATR